VSRCDRWTRWSEASAFAIGAAISGCSLSIESVTGNLGDRWVPETTWASIAALPASREALMTRFAPLSAL